MQAIDKMLAGMLTRLLVLVTLGCCGVAFAGGDLVPDVPQANARFSDTQGCVEPTDEMRRNHMEYILHQRDETMHRGIRTKQYSLAECINCHVPPASGGKKVRVDSEEHFCKGCHSYAAVTIDCFQCHSDQPTGEPLTSSISDTHGSGNGISPRLLQMFAAGEANR